MHYHPFAQNLWFPLGSFVLTGLAGIPLMLLGGALSQIVTAIVAALMGGGGA